MSMPFNGTRLREARRFRNLSITELADKVNISKQMISKYERGDSIPSAKTYSKLVFVLQFPLSFFQQSDKFTQINRGTFYRSRFTSTQTEKKQTELKKKYLAVLANLFEHYVDFPLLEKNSEFSSNPAIAAQELRIHWGLGTSPISDMVPLLEKHGFKLALVSSKTSKVDAFSSSVEINGIEYYCILIETQNNAFFRQQFSLAHELGHWVLHSGKVQPQELDTNEYHIMEDEANTFAANFLLPAVQFKNDIVDDKENLSIYCQLKKKWKVSISSMIYRANSLGILSPNEFRNLQKKISYHHWRKVEPLDKEVFIKKPVLMRQAFELINQVESFDANVINEKLDKEYGMPLPLNVISELIGVSEDQLRTSTPKIINGINFKNH